MQTPAPANDREGDPRDPLLDILVEESAGDDAQAEASAAILAEDETVFDVAEAQVDDEVEVEAHFSAVGGAAAAVAQGEAAPGEATQREVAPQASEPQDGDEGTAPETNADRTGDADGDGDGDEYVFGYGGWTVTPETPDVPAGTEPHEASEAALTPPPPALPAPPQKPITKLKQRLRARPQPPTPAAAPPQSHPAALDDAATIAEPAPPARPRRGGQKARIGEAPPRRRPEALAPPAPATQGRDDDRPLIGARPERGGRGKAADRGRGRRPARQERPIAAQTADDAAPPPREDAPSRPHKLQRIEGGGTVMIGDGLFEILEWSTGGLSIASSNSFLRVGDGAMLELELDMGDYAVNLDLDGEVVARTSERIDWRFVSATETQRQVLRSLVNAFVQGRSFTAAPVRGGPYGLSGGPAARRGLGTRRERRARSSLGGLVAVVLNLALTVIAVAFVVSTLTGNGLAPTIAADPAPASLVQAKRAAVAVERITLASDRAGTILEWGALPGTSVDNGEAIVSLLLREDVRPGAAASDDAPVLTADATLAADSPQSPSADEEAAVASDAEAPAPQDAAAPEGDDGDRATERRRAVVQSPCDCFLSRIIASPGRRVDAGEPIGLLYSRGSTGHIQSLFAAGEAPNIGDTVLVELPFAEMRFDGVVESVGRLSDPDSYIGLREDAFEREPGAVFARIRPLADVPASLAGDAAIVTVAPRS